MAFTKGQYKATVLKGDSLLISAAAGAGKTTVLTERVRRMLCDCDSGVSADRLMVLTFTNAAAAEMRRRITDAMRKELENDPENEHIRTQLSKLRYATITTIDSACLDIVRKNFSLLGIDPQFVIEDQITSEIERQEFMEEFTDTLYGRAQTEPDINDLIEYFSNTKGEYSLVTTLSHGADFMSAQPYPQKYLEIATATDTRDIFEIFPDVKNELITVLDNAISGYDLLISTAKRVLFEPDPVVEFYLNDVDGLSLLRKNIVDADFGKAVELLREFDYKGHLKYSKKRGERSDWDSLLALRNSIKSTYDTIKNDYFDYENVSDALQPSSLTDILVTFVKLCIEFNDTLLQKHIKKRAFTFDDITKFTLQLVVDDYDGKTVTKTKLATELSKGIDEIIIDEYQDCNLVQDIIFKALSKEGKNIFMVGDVKQSIYKFREARPDLFVKKQNEAEYPLDDTEILTCPAKLDLNHNFRSHPKILEFVNAVFIPLMTRERCGIDYKQNHTLTTGGGYPQGCVGGVTVSLINAPAKSDSETMAQCEAREVARMIKSIIGVKKIFDVKTGALRTVSANDIAILMRAPRTNGLYYEKALEEAGINCVNNNPSSKYLETSEVRDILCYLQAIDNPYDDIALVSVMCSDYFGFGSDLLADIRANCKYGAFYDAVCEYAKKDDSVNRFVTVLASLRKQAQTTDVYGIINAIFQTSGILIRLAGKKGGDTALANLVLFADIAAQYESTQYRGLFSFINFIRKLSERDNKLPSAKLRADNGAVTIQSIHKSKGLEYPVVFVVNCATKPKKASFDNILLTEDGAGAIIKDAKKYKLNKSFLYSYLRNKEIKEEINESARFLYVALTRAKSELYVTACLDVATAEKEIKNAYYGVEKGYYSPNSFFGWILSATIHTHSAAKFRAYAGLETPPGEGDLYTAQVIFPDTETSDDTQNDTVLERVSFTQPIETLLSRKYAFEADTTVPSKLSVSEIKGMKSADRKIYYKKPRFMSGGVGGADRGNATHTFLQFCRFENITDSDSFDKELSRLGKGRFISESDINLVKKDKILAFLLSDQMNKLMQSGKCHKEERFVFTVAANTILDTKSCEKVTVQGVIDCWFETADGAVILDYKTDKVKTEAELTARYAAQLDMYARAIESKCDISVSKKMIYSFCLSKFIEL